MGTRFLICVVKDEQYRVAQYGQWDGDPEGQGIDILMFLRERLNRPLFEKQLGKLSWITEEEFEQEWISCGGIANGGVITANFKACDEYARRFPHNNRDTGSKILDIIQKTDNCLKIRNSLDFAADSLWCEWAYIIDLDKNTFEVYKGFNKQPLQEGERFVTFTPPKRNPQYSSQYYPVKFVVAFNLNDLPTKEEFLEKFIKPDGDQVLE